MPTLEEIARLSEVSRSTVSRVVNDDPHVSPATRQKVWAVVQRLNYRPNAVARSLAAGRTRTLGLMATAGTLTAQRDPLFATFLQGLAQGCSACGYAVMLWLAPPGGEPATADRLLSHGMLDGLVIATATMPDPVLERLAREGLPYVFVGRPGDGRDAVSYVTAEDRRGVLEATTHLLRLGRRHIAYLGGPPTDPTARARLQGYREALAGRGLPAEAALIREGDFTEAAGAYEMARLLDGGPPVDAVVAANDLMALGALRALRAAGRPVPAAVAVVGCDDIPAAASADPPLTTVRRPAARLGAVAAETLIDMIEHGATFPRRVVLPTELVIRASCGAMAET